MNRKAVDVVRASLLALLCVYLGLKLAVSSMTILTFMGLDWKAQPLLMMTVFVASLLTVVLLAVGIKCGVAGVRQYWLAAVEEARPNMNMAAVAAAGEQMLVNLLRAYTESDSVALVGVAAIWALVVVWNGARYRTRKKRLSEARWKLTN